MRETADVGHPLHLLERAATEYSKASDASRRADLRAGQYIGERGSRAAVLAARARAKKLDSAQLLQHAAILFAAWATTVPASTTNECERVPKHLAHELLDADYRARGGL